MDCHGYLYAYSFMFSCSPTCTCTAVYVCCLCTYSLQFPPCHCHNDYWFVVSSSTFSLHSLLGVFTFVSMNCHKLRLWFYIILLHVCASGSPTSREISQKLRCSLPWLLMSRPSSHFFPCYSVFSLLLSKVSVTARVDAILLKRL